MDKQLEELKAKIAAHPWPVVGAAFAFGALIAMRGHRGEDGERSIRSMLAAALGAVAVKLIKSYAFGMVGDAAKDWIGDRVNTGSTERAASRDPAVESFLEH